MAGSFLHCVDDQGRLLDSTDLAGMLENGGDVWEAVEELYGTIYFLASAAGTVPDADVIRAHVEQARKNYRIGLQVAGRVTAR